MIKKYTKEVINRSLQIFAVKLKFNITNKAAKNVIRLTDAMKGESLDNQLLSYTNRN